MPYSSFLYLDFHLFHDKAKRTQQGDLLGKHRFSTNISIILAALMMFSSSTLKWPFLEFENLANNIKCDVGNNERSLRTMSKMKMMTVDDNDDDNDNASLISLC